ncbi:hypothetical protein C4J81_09690 [Deltaproteobacteria bacterium Smac51]|nr:hypothetical protein C4J81_09690 [Deltaproteobacteria bacterium Smac51]
MSFKKVLPVLALASIMAFSSTAALAQQSDRSDNTPPPPPGKVLNDEDRAAYYAMWQTHRQKVSPMQDRLWAKSMEYDALAGNPNTKPGDINPVIDEMSQLRGQLRAEHDGFIGQLNAKGIGPANGYGPGMCYGGGMGYGHMGYGSDMGYGKGYGKGYHRGPGKGRHHGGGGGYHHNGW